MSQSLPPPLPSPKTGGLYGVGLVCLGNICRSPIADVVLSEYVDRAGLAGRVEVHSSGTGDWHVGQPMDTRAAATLCGEGYDPSRHRAHQIDQEWAGDLDLVLAMDETNLVDVRHVLAPLWSDLPDRVRLFRDFDPVGPGDVPDPYYGGEDGFAEVLAMVERTCAVLVNGLAKLLGGHR